MRLRGSAVTRRHLLAAGGLVAGGALLGATPAVAGGQSTVDRSRRLLATYGADTWRSFAAMVDDATGLPSDNIGGDLAPGTRSAYTSPTNIGMYLWAITAARHMGLLTRPAARDRASRVLRTLAGLQRHEASGMYYNWYDPHTGAVLRTWPSNGNTVYPFLSSVDNGWLASALLVTANDLPELSGPAWSLLRRMDFGFYYDPAARAPDFPAGLIRGGFWDEEPPQCAVVDNYRDRGPDVWYTCHHYGAFNTEPRIASYLGIALNQIPAGHYFAGWRTFPASCDWEWQEQKPVGAEATYLGVPVFEGTYGYRGMRLVPTWGGSMFEALMVPLVMPEETWAPGSWGRNHPVYVQAQIEHGLREAKYGFWGFSPSSDPTGEYREYGVDPIGMDAAGYTSDAERTSVDYGFAGCREPKPAPESYGDGVVTPHAAFLALRYAPGQTLDNLARLRGGFDIYGPGGFYDAVAVRSGTVARRYLALDQGMIIAAIANALHDDVLRTAFTRGPVTALRPMLALEQWPGVSP